MRGRAFFPGQARHLRAASSLSLGYTDAGSNPCQGSTDVIGHVNLDATAGAVTFDLDTSMDWRNRLLRVDLTCRDAGTAGVPGNVFTSPWNVWPRKPSGAGQILEINGIFLTGIGWDEAAARNPDTWADATDLYNGNLGPVKIYCYRTILQPSLRILATSGSWYCTYWIQASERIY